MKRMMKSVVGVTLLEIMLVLAIAAMIIVMSVRYYQSASANQQANGALQMVQGITAAADGLAQGSGSYLTGGVSGTTVAQLMPNGSMVLPWGSTATIGSVAASTYLVTLPQTPVAVCQALLSRIKANPKFTNPACASTTAPGNFTYTYNNTF